MDEKAKGFLKSLKIDGEELFNKLPVLAPGPKTVSGTVQLMIVDDSPHFAKMIRSCLGEVHQDGQAFRHEILPVEPLTLPRLDTGFLYFFRDEMVSIDRAAGRTRKYLWAKYPDLTKAQTRKSIRRIPRIIDIDEGMAL